MTNDQSTGDDAAACSLSRRRAIGRTAAVVAGWSAQALVPARAAGRRIAFVIGNARYTNEVTLTNPHNDARLLADVLKRELRFDELVERRDALPAADLVDALQNSGARLALLILDACRDSPYSRRARSSSKGLIRLNLSGGNLLVAYATSVGQIANDDAAEPNRGVEAAQRLVDQRVCAVVGHLNSGTSSSAAAIYANAGIAQPSPSATNPRYTRLGHRTAFRQVGDDSAMGHVLERIAARTRRARRIVVIDDRTALGLADEFEKGVKSAGQGFAGRAFTNDKATDFSAILTGTT